MTTGKVSASLARLPRWTERSRIPPSTCPCGRICGPLLNSPRFARRSPISARPTVTQTAPHLVNDLEKDRCQSELRQVFAGAPLDSMGHSGRCQHRTGQSVRPVVLIPRYEAARGIGREDLQGRRLICGYRASRFCILAGWPRRLSCAVYGRRISWQMVVQQTRASRDWLPGGAGPRSLVRSWPG